MSTPKQKSLCARLVSFIPLCLANEVTIFSINLLNMAPSTFYKFNNIETFIKLSITYTCINNQLWLSILVTSSQLTTRNNDLSTTTLMAHNMTQCITVAMVQPIESLQCFRGQCFHLQKLKTQFELFKVCHWATMFEQVL